MTICLRDPGQLNSTPKSAFPGRQWVPNGRSAATPSVADVVAKKTHRNVVPAGGADHSAPPYSSSPWTKLLLLGADNLPAYGGHQVAAYCYWYKTKKRNLHCHRRHQRSHRPFE